MLRLTCSMCDPCFICQFRFRRAVVYNGLKSKVGLAAAKTAAIRINLNIDGCGVVAPVLSSSSRDPLLADLLAHNLPLPRAAQSCEVASLERTGRG